MSNRSRAHLATKTCQIKRVTMTNGKTDLPKLHLADIACTPLMSLEENTFMQTRQPAISGTAVSRKQVMIFDNYEIIKGDIHVMDGVERAITDVNPWSVTEPFMVLILNDVKGPVENTAIFER